MLKNIENSKRQKWACAMWLYSLHLPGLGAYLIELVYNAGLLDVEKLTKISHSEKDAIKKFMQIRGIEEQKSSCAP